MGNVILYFFLRFMGEIPEEKKITQLPPGTSTLVAYLCANTTTRNFKDREVRDLVSKRLEKFRNYQTYHLTPERPYISMNVVKHIFRRLRAEFELPGDEFYPCTACEDETLFYSVRALFQMFRRDSDSYVLPDIRYTVFENIFNSILESVGVTRFSHPQEIQCVFDLIRYCSNLLFLSIQNSFETNNFAKWTTKLQLRFPWIEQSYPRQELYLKPDVIHFHYCRICQKGKCEKCMADIFRVSTISLSSEKEYRNHCCRQLQHKDL